MHTTEMLYSHVFIPCTVLVLRKVYRQCFHERKGDALDKSSYLSASYRPCSLTLPQLHTLA